MDRVTRFNVLAMCGRAVEAAGDVDTLLLDKTGTITFGNRMAAEFVPVGGATPAELASAAQHVVPRRRDAGGTEHRGAGRASVGCREAEPARCPLGPSWWPSAPRRA